jgi:thiol:disulfide interchange protein DsbG
MRIYLLLIATLLLSSCSTPKHVHTDAELNLLVARISHQSAHLVKRFEAPQGFTGMVVRGNDSGARETTAWLTADGRYLLVGSLFDEHGRDAADVLLTRADSGAMTEEEFLRRVQTAAAVTQFPTGTRTISIFADADCVFCWQLFQQISRLSDEFKESSVRVRWIMVGTQSLESARRGAAILQQGLAGLATNEMGYNVALSHGGIEPLEDAKYLGMVGDNTKILLRSPTSATATPTLVWQSSRGVQTYLGAPDEKALRDILGQVQPDRAQR